MSKITSHSRVKKGEEGSIYKTNQCGELIILQYESALKVHVKFLETGYETTARISNIVDGKVKDLLAKTVYGEGVLGEKVSKESGKYPKEFLLWRNMLKRCYNPASVAANKTYEGCSVSEEFKYFPYFREWCKNQIGCDQVGWHLDKDILNPQGKKYSAEYCVFVPIELNCLIKWNKTITEEDLIGVRYHKKLGKFSAAITCDGVEKRLGLFNTRLEAYSTYKEAKELAIKEVAERWKGKIDERVYEKLVNFELKMF